MKKFFLGTFIFLDLALIFGASFVLYAYVTHKVSLASFPSLSNPLSSKPGIAPGTGAAPSLPVPASTSTSHGSLLAPPPPGESSTRKILFKYNNSHARQVSIRADFTGWKATPMVKTANGVWTYQAPLPPGEYAYCFTADDKTFKDPANKRTKLIGRTTVSAILVEALPAKTPK